MAISYAQMNEFRRGNMFIRVDHKSRRLLLEIERGFETRTIDVTDIYYFLKELFTTDWESKLAEHKSKEQ